MIGHIIVYAFIGVCCLVAFVFSMAARSYARNRMSNFLFDRPDQVLEWIDCPKCDGMTAQVLLWNDKKNRNEWCIIPVHMRSFMSGKYARNNANYANARECPHCQGLGRVEVSENADDPMHLHRDGTFNGKWW